MVVRPERNNAQFQPLTIVLRNIIKEYPAGGGVLRELCQNADDAGASEVKFVLDRRQHPTENILHKGLAEFQGTSLLAYNNSSFSDLDFESLSRIGDSAKIKDLSATGKFGRGFNSVYNWTDTPSILSGSSLLILDPHQTWSIEVGQPGGPVYDFVKNSQELEMRNQLAAFSSINQNFHSKFDGTIIRLPLRTESQATASKILVSGKPTTDNEIIDIFRKFAGELVETLLFLKNLHTITLQIDDKTYAKAASTTHSFSNANGKPFGKASISTGYKRVFVERATESCSIDFVMDISLSIGQIEGDGEISNQKFKFAISHHLGKGPADRDLEIWSRSQKLFSWVAVAIPLQGYEEFEGRLFSTLPLPIRTKHPAHIHGMFSITPDRNSIHSGGDWTISEDSEAKLGTKWNQWLLQECVPNTWIQGLKFIQGLNLKGECDFSGWNFWPAGNKRVSEGLWMDILGVVFKRVVERDLELLPTICDTVRRRTDVLFVLDILNELASALKHAGVSVVVPPEDRRYELEKLRPYAIGLMPLQPSSARTCLSQLKDSPGFRGLILEFRMTLLHYVLSDEDFHGIGTCTAPLVPLVDDTYASFDCPVTHVRSVFLARDDDEVKLFGKYKKMVDISRIPPKAIKLMRKNISTGKLQGFTKISAWEKDDVARYCGKYIFNKHRAGGNDIIQMDGLVDFVNQLWKWISIRCRPFEVANSSLKDIFLLPLIGGEYRRLGSAIPVLDVSRNRGIGAFLRSTTTDGRRFHLFTGNGFSSHVGNSLRNCGFVKDYEDIEPLMEWLIANRESFVQQLSKSEKILLLQHLNPLSRNKLDGSQERVMRKAVAILSLFQEAVPDKRIACERPWISINKFNTSYVGVKDVPLQLRAINTIFIDINNPDTEQIVTRMGLASCPQATELFEKYIIPGLAGLDDELRVSHGEYVLRNYHVLSPRSKGELSQIEIVPVQCSLGEISLKRPIDIVALGSVVASLYFEDECRLPVEGFYRLHHMRLLELGMVNTITDEMVLNRISEYGRRGINHPLDEIAAKAQQLLIHYSTPPLLPQEVVQSLEWIPAQDLDGKMGLFSAIKCRDRGRERLAKYIMPLVEFPVNPAWAECFGWDQPLPKPQLLEQLKRAVIAKDNIIIDSLIVCGELEACITELSKMEWIPSTAGVYFSPSKIFFNDFRDLSPYFGTLENRSKKIALFKKLEIRNAPSLIQLRELQEHLAKDTVLEGSNLEKAIFIVTEVGKRFPGRKHLYDFKAPDKDGRMRFMSELTAGDPGNADVDLQILHPGISLDTVKKLGISTFEDRYLELLNDPYFEGEFAQRESPAAVIEDTLKRYPIKSTFNEYLANAEDCGNASKVCWILDTTDNYPKTHLLSPQLAEVQGPALFCYNDEMFTDDDFRGIVNIGIGSKSGSPSKIGKFGKGALTMYHWTSVPSFISGDYYVIFDPGQRYLPEHPSTKRPRAGMKIKIEHVRKQRPDQLRPFEDILGFGKDSTSFPGTLFRFPLRRSESLAQEKITIFEARKYLEDYYHEATTSLLFLKNIKSISFWDKFSKDPVWVVTSKESTIPDEPPHITHVTIKRRLSSIPESPDDSDKWCIIRSQYAGEIPSLLVNTMRKERLEAKYGLAALLSKPPGGFYAQHFLGLPLQFIGKLGLPVHVNADVIIGSNRQSIPIREGKEGSTWNKWIYESGVAPLYLDLVRYLMQIDLGLDYDGYCYWPEYPSKTLIKNTDSVSRTISTAFWKLVASNSSPLYPPLRLPSASTTINQRASRNLSLKASIFNLLNATDEKLMLPLLSKLGVENIVSPSQAVRNGLREMQPSSLNVITPSYFITRLHLLPARYQDILLEIWAHEKNYSMDFFNSLLSFITRQIELTSLFDCALLPLANLTLGTLLPNGGGNENFLVAGTPEEREILDVSQNLMVHPGLDPTVAQVLVLSGKLNITRFTPNDITRLRPILEDRDAEYRKNWLIKVWAYLRNYPTHLPQPQLVCFENMPMYFGKTIGGEHTFFCPSDFENFRYPVILEQSGLMKDALLVLGSLEGLILLDKSAFPEKNLSQESIKSVTGLYRLLRSIDLLASKNGLFIEEYIIKTIPSKSIETLRNLFPPTLLSELLKKYLPAKEYLMQFPIWPVTDSRALVHQPATKALLPPLAKLTSLGMTKGDVFIEASTAKMYSRQLEHLGVKRMTLDNFLRNHVGICLAHEIPPDKKPSYPSLLKILLSETDVCSRYPIGVDGNGRFCMLDSLYASDVPVFMAAFRDLEKTRFLHLDYRNMEIWQRSSIQRAVTEDRYLASARSIQRRATEGQTGDHDLIRDAEEVFNYLTWDTPEIRQWTSITWRDLSKIAFAPIRTVSITNPEHRRSRMHELSGDTKLTTFVDGILADYVDIAWSQCPILHNQPSSFVLSKIPTRGIPSPNNVLSHLVFLSNNRHKVAKAQILDYVKDIKASYMHLLRQPMSYEGIRTTLGADNIWFNAEVEDISPMSTEEFQKSWTNSSNLCLGLEYDSLPLQKVRSFLAPFQELLGHFGVRKLKGPAIPAQVPRIADHSSLVLSGFRRLRAEGRSFDVKLVVQSQVFQAHWALLSAVSLYWDRMFVSGMIEMRTRTVELHEMRPKIVSILLDYIYSGQIPTIGRSADVSNDLEDLIDLLYGADIWGLDDLKTILGHTLCDKHWIRPETVRIVLHCAEEVRATILIRVCRQYILENDEIVQREE